MNSLGYWTTVITAASSFAAAILPRQPSDNTIVVGSGTQGLPLLASFFSYSIEFYYFPDFAGKFQITNNIRFSLTASLRQYVLAKRLLVQPSSKSRQLH